MDSITALFKQQLQTIITASFQFSTEWKFLNLIVWNSAMLAPFLRISTSDLGNQWAVVLRRFLLLLLKQQNCLAKATRLLVYWPQYYARLNYWITATGKYILYYWVSAIQDKAGRTVSKKKKIKYIYLLHTTKKKTSAIILNLFLKET